MQIKTYRPDFEIWKLNDEEIAEILQRLRADLGDDWRSAPPEVINETLRDYLYQDWKPCEEVTGEGFLPTEISGRDGFFETPPIDPCDLSGHKTSKMKEKTPPRDLFEEIVENPDAVPRAVHEILDEWDENAEPYAECRRINDRLKPLGYTFNWGLSGEPYNLRRII
jgi:hypothetical protein